MKNNRTKWAVKLSLVALALTVAMVALHRNAEAWSTRQMAQSQWQQARVDQSRSNQERVSWARWQSEQLKQARLYQEKLNRAQVYSARVLSLQSKAREQLAKIESWHKRTDRLARQKAAREKNRRAATLKDKRFVQVLVQSK